MRISDWSSDVCSSDLKAISAQSAGSSARTDARRPIVRAHQAWDFRNRERQSFSDSRRANRHRYRQSPDHGQKCELRRARPSCHRSEEHTSELQSLMRISYAVFCLKKKKKTRQLKINTN